MEFVKTAEGDGVEVYEARYTAKREPFRDEEGNELDRGPLEVLLPFRPDAATKQLADQAFKAFAKRTITALSISSTGGIEVRVTQRTCSKCGAVLADEHRFCPDCGTDSKEKS